MKKTIKKESNILLIIALFIYAVTNVIDRLIIEIPDIIYIMCMFISIGIIFSALKSQRQGK